MIVDGHHHIVDMGEPILRLMDRQGVDRAVLVGVGVNDIEAVTISDSLVFRSDFLLKTFGLFKSLRVLRSLKKRKILLATPRNDAVLRAMTDHPDRFTGFAFINPLHPDSKQEAVMCLEAGMSGLKFAHLQYPPDFDGKVMIPFAELAHKAKVPIFIHLGLDLPVWLDRLVANFPEVIFILAHAAVQHFDYAVKLAKKRSNIWFDTSSYFVTDKKLNDLVATVGTGRIVFGSDMPVMATSMTEGIEKIRRLQLDISEEKALLGGNLQRILSLKQ